MGASVLVQARVDEDIKREAAEVLDGLGLSVSDLVRMVLTKTARQKALPVGLVVTEEGHDAWFRAKVQEALNDPRPGITNEEAKLRMRQHRAKVAERLGR